VPTTVTLASCSTSTCPGSTTIEVPVLYPDLPIVGPNILCLGASGTYTLPHLPGTFYKWTVTGGPYSFNQQDKNVSQVNISFNAPGPYWVKCEYKNPLAGCNGVDSILVNILPKFEIAGIAPSSSTPVSLIARATILGPVPRNAIKPRSVSSTPKEKG